MGIVNSSSSTFNAKARVICKATGDKLTEYLGNYVDSGKYDVSFDLDSTCGSEEYMPCCIVLLERPTK